MRAVAQVFTFDLFAKVMLAGTGILVIRFLPRAEYAQYTIAVAIVAVASQILGGTMNRVFIVGHDRIPVRDPISAVVAFQLLVIAGAAVVATPLLVAMPAMGMLVLAVVVASCLSEFAKTVFQREMRFLRFSLVELSRAAVFLAGVLLLARFAGLDMQAWQVLAVQAAAMLLVFAIAVGRRIRWRGLLELPVMGTLIGAIFRGGYRDLFGYFAVLAVLSQVNVAMLKLMAGEDPLAAYGVAFRYYAMLLLALGAVNQVLLPAVQRASAEELHALLRDNLRLTGVFALGIVAVVIFAPWVLPLLDGGKYPDAIPALQVLALSTIPSLALSPYANLLMRWEDFRFLLWLVVAALAVNLVVGAVLIPAGGAPGAALAYFTAFMVLNGAIFARARSGLAAASLRAEALP